MSENWPTSLTVPADAEPAQLAAVLTNEGIDDLAKLRIAQLLWRAPQVVGDAAFFARLLGFHSASATAQALDELVERGLLARWPPSGPGSRYGLARRRVASHAVDCRLVDEEGCPAMREVVNLLARRSLERVRRAATERSRMLRRARFG